MPFLLGLFRSLNEGVLLYLNKFGIGYVYSTNFEAYFGLYLFSIFPINQTLYFTNQLILQKLLHYVKF
jgi:hypothetical protein